ncbi:hypothetical protein PIB30_033900 [Stylosanthes scabra]|uniref:Transposase MuDR plant domain-containing protein n=1 Tax=Stylosanthes scabra TaxID=79078 RepID=A0ABU6VBC4_9FABA|nr:hypothetical protein [Stylosanthes scabra]
MDDVYHAEVGCGDDEDDLGGQGVVFPVYKLQKDMKEYRDEFKDAVVAYVVQNARGVTFKNCDLWRVRARCANGCPFWLYAAKMQGESTWQLRSMNTRHTCGKAQRVRMLHSKWLGKTLKKID